MHDPHLKRSHTGVYNFVWSAPEQPAVDARSIAAVTNKK